jgi:hypothetical protein
MDAAETLQAGEELGFRIEWDGLKLEIVALGDRTDAPPKFLVDAIKKNAAEIIALLQKRERTGQERATEGNKESPPHGDRSQGAKAEAPQVKLRHVDQEFARNLAIARAMSGAPMGMGPAPRFATVIVGPGKRATARGLQWFQDNGQEITDPEVIRRLEETHKRNVERAERDRQRYGRGR